MFREVKVQSPPPLHVFIGTRRTESATRLQSQVYAELAEKQATEMHQQLEQKRREQDLAALEERILQAIPRPIVEVQPSSANTSFSKQKKLIEALLDEAVTLSNELVHLERSRGEGLRFEGRRAERGHYPPQNGVSASREVCSRRESYFISEGPVPGLNCSPTQPWVVM